MKLFTQRLVELLLAVVLGCVVFGALVLTFNLLTLIHPMVPGVILLAGAAAMLLVFVWVFIDWLFIEPFRKGRSK